MLAAKTTDSLDTVNDRGTRPTKSRVLDEEEKKDKPQNLCEVCFVTGNRDAGARVLLFVFQTAQDTTHGLFKGMQNSVKKSRAGIDNSTNK